MTTSWQIVSFKSVGNLRFGSSHSEVARVLGIIHREVDVHPELDGSIQEFRGLELPSCVYKNGELIGVGTSWRLDNLEFQEKRLFELSPLDCLRFLESKNKGAIVRNDMVLFMKLGISALGFFNSKDKTIFHPKSGEKDKRKIGIFSSGEFTEFVPSASIVSFLGR